MKFAQRWLAVFLLAGSSCDRVRSLLPSAVNRKETVAPAPADIPPGDLNSFSQQSGKVAIVEFYGIWSGQSRQLAPLLQTLVAEHGGRMVVGKVDIDKYKDFATRENVRTVPDVRIYRGGRMVDRFVGLPDQDEIRGRIDRQVRALPATAPGTPSGPSKGIVKPMPKDWLPPGMQRR